jgi:hypothetical protein
MFIKKIVKSIFRATTKIFIANLANDDDNNVDDDDDDEREREKRMREYIYIL